MIDKELIQTICKAGGHVKEFTHLFSGDIDCACVMLSRSKLAEDRYALRGFLTEPETLKAWFGETEYEYASNGEKCGYKNRGWNYHGQQIVGSSLEEILKYYEQSRIKRND